MVNEGQKRLFIQWLPIQISQSRYPNPDIPIQISNPDIQSRYPIQISNPDIQSRYPLTSKNSPPILPAIESNTLEALAKLFQICSPSLDGRGLGGGCNCNMQISWQPPPHPNPPPPGGGGNLWVLLQLPPYQKISKIVGGMENLRGTAFASCALGMVMAVTAWFSRRSSTSPGYRASI